jgi:hypothetical protein
MRYDQLEKKNLYNNNKNGHCFINFDNYDIQKLKKSFDLSIAKNYCQKQNNNFNQKAIDSGDINNKSKTNFDVENKIEQQHSSENFCIEHHYRMILGKVLIILNKLTPFVKYGNSAHQKFLSVDNDKNAICEVPVFSRIKKIDFSDNSDCKTSAVGCSVPEY